MHTLRDTCSTGSLQDQKAHSGHAVTISYMYMHCTAKLLAITIELFTDIQGKQLLYTCFQAFKNQKCHHNYMYMYI